MSAMFVMFIFITDIGPGLGSVGSELFYDGQEMSRIVSIYDRFVKLSQGLICDAQSITLSETIITLSENIIDAFL
jgi:hypothetical protein